MSQTVTNPAVRELFDAINAGDRPRFLAALTPDAMLFDDGTPQDVEAWIDREVFSVNGHVDVESEDPDGLSVIARYRNDTWGEMRTAWRFAVTDGKVGRIDTGQA